MSKNTIIGVLSLLALTMVFSCGKDQGEVLRKEYIDFYKSVDDEAASKVVSVTVMGGTASFTVRSNVEFTASWQDDLKSPWAAVESLEKKGDDLYELTLSFRPRSSGAYYTRRTGTLLLSAPSEQLGSFITVHQGLTTPVASDFSWSKYGTSDPRKLDGTVYSQWINNDKNRGWVTADDEAVYGKNGFLMLGDETGKGGSICSPFYEGIRKDSLAAVSFRAVAFTDKDGNKDGNKFTVEIIDGGVFRDNGSTKMELEAPYADITASDYPANFWNGADFLVGIVSSDQNPFTGNTRIRISASGSGTPNRVFIDNFYIRTIDMKNGDEDIWTSNGGSGKDNLLGAPTVKSND